MATLFTTQTPTAQTSEAAPGPTLGTVIIPAVAGTVDQLGVYAPSTLPSNAATAPLVLWDRATGTELGRAVRGSLTADAWNWVTLTTPVAVSAGQALVVSWRTADRYAYIGGFFTSAGLTNGLLSAPATGSDPVGNGRFRTSLDAYPSQTFGGHCYLTDLNFTPSSSGVAVAGTARAAGTVRSVVVKAVAVAARCIAFATGRATARKVAPATARSVAVPIGRVSAKHVGVVVGRQVAAPAGSTAAVKRVAVTGTSTAAASALMSGSSRAATGRCVAAARVTAVASHRTAVAGTACAAPVARATAVHRTAVTAGSPALATIRAVATKRLASSGQAVAAVTAVGIAGPVGSTRPAVGRCTAVAICTSRTRHRTPRPNSGITTRPFAGITYRP